MTIVLPKPRVKKPKSKVTDRFNKSVGKFIDYEKLLTKKKSTITSSRNKPAPEIRGRVIGGDELDAIRKPHGSYINPKTKTIRHFQKQKRV